MKKRLVLLLAVIFCSQIFCSCLVDYFREYEYGSCMWVSDNPNITIIQGEQKLGVFIKDGKEINIVFQDHNDGPTFKLSSYEIIDGEIKVNDVYMTGRFEIKNDNIIITEIYEDKMLGYKYSQLTLYYTDMPSN